MKTFVLPAFLLVLAVLPGCISPTSYDYEQAALEEMSNYKTFTIDSRETRSNYQDVVLSPIVDRRIERAIQRELTAKGFESVSANPDFRVTFNTVTKTRTEINDFGPPPFRRHPYYGYSGRHLDIDEYEEGTFLINIVDRASKQLVWRGAYVKRLGWSAPDEAEVQKIVSSILAGFPPEQPGG
ncbi:hypothetical protein DDZ13_00460 [Coraliomargarita sinensis]|uniref:DUF4136 domain-containing protein n=1 Tax=Coraliomargarita sinensis TaxID=2174842 RepID=A0A317ZK32_9BACT|nr:DUF4136 domain-containing protein [Coraliomargarita sinensis]PXA05372.1 hypothetical protein DDZ13_00460 [Coraliomargarita sinensis]